MRVPAKVLDTLTGKSRLEVAKSSFFIMVGVNFHQGKVISGSGHGEISHQRVSIPFGVTATILARLCGLFSLLISHRLPCWHIPFGCNCIIYGYRVAVAGKTPRHYGQCVALVYRARSTAFVMYRAANQYAVTGAVFAVKAALYIF
jgi:hypothetical protein